MAKKNALTRIYIPRMTPKISTSSKIFIDKKTRSNHRRILNKITKDW